MKDKGEQSHSIRLSTLVNLKHFAIQETEKQNDLIEFVFKKCFNEKIKK